MKAPLPITNRAARHNLLHANALGTAGSNVPAIEMVKKLGLVQIDSIQVISRAHHHILWSRNLSYREADFDSMLEEDRSVFEHFTHDASILPMEVYPYWRRQFARRANDFKNSSWGEAMANEDERSAIVDRIADEGPLSTSDFHGKPADKKSHAWARPPHKLALDYLWHCGELAIPYRRNFVKYYDLAERVIPTSIFKKEISDETSIAYLCSEALRHLVFATPGEIQRFWNAMSLPEVRAWIHRRRSDLVECEVSGADGSRSRAWAFDEGTELLKNPAPVTSRLRIINPFDPLIRDRKRLAQFFGFDFRIEIFVPAAKRKFGYYVYPILEGSRFIGRIEATADRKMKTLSVKNLWMEPGISLTQKRSDRLNLELKRIAKLASVKFERIAEF